MCYYPFKKIYNIFAIDKVICLKNTILLLSFLISLNAFAQGDTIPKSILNSYTGFYKEYLKHGVQDKWKENYAQDMSFAKFNNVFYHKVYYNQPVLVEYVRNILNRLEPNHSIIDGMDIYIARSTQFNAFTIADGSIFINIAALAKMSSEAELAYLLAHEYGHYKLEHVKNKYLRLREIGTGRDGDDFNSFSQHTEMKPIVWHSKWDMMQVMINEPWIF